MQPTHRNPSTFQQNSVKPERFTGNNPRSINLIILNMLNAIMSSSKRPFGNAGIAAYFVKVFQESTIFPRIHGVLLSQLTPFCSFRFARTSNFVTLSPLVNSQVYTHPRHVTASPLPTHRRLPIKYLLRAYFHGRAALRRVKWRDM